MSTFTPYRPDDAAALVSLWNVGAGQVAPLGPLGWRWATEADPAFDPSGLLVARARSGVPLGFVLAKTPPPGPGLDRYAGMGWIVALAVAPEAQGQGLGRALLTAGEAWLARRGVREVALGGSFHHLWPGLPAGLAPARALLERAGYRWEPDCWDVFRDLREAPALATPAPPPGLALRPCEPTEVPAVLALLRREFAGRWPHDVAAALASGASRPEDLLIATNTDGPLGFAHLHPPGAVGAARWADGLSGVAALGPIGLAAEARGGGLGRALLLAGLHTLALRGAGPCVIDWTDLLEFYAHAGFRPWRCYHRARRSLS